mmetsp:Transcript_7481/g.28117  ORF Transcript_7481/g.28117 Transcript_7481/m.28117 type:complete len:249 (-) Transcript_7481:57-803(-)
MICGEAVSERNAVRSEQFFAANANGAFFFKLAFENTFSIGDTSPRSLVPLNALAVAAACSLDGSSSDTCTFGNSLAAWSSWNTATTRRPGTRVFGHCSFQLFGAALGTTPRLSSLRAAAYKPASRGLASRRDVAVVHSKPPGSSRPSRNASTKLSEVVAKGLLPVRLWSSSEPNVFRCGDAAFPNSPNGDVHDSSRFRRPSITLTRRTFNCFARRAASRNHDSACHAGSCGSIACAEISGSRSERKCC